MCGIAGIVGPGGEAIGAMTARLRHRGPDAEGFWSDPAAGVYLGHRRLSILDLAGGSQPLVASDGQTVLVYNGELYNHPELRQELTTKGHLFQSAHSDTETVLHSYLEWGPDSVERFNGMFALAIWDGRRRRLFLARDRFGEKPLFYARSASGLAFASELGALKLWPSFSNRVDGDNVQRYLAWGYFPGESTLYEQCWSLPSGGWMIHEPDRPSVPPRRYWQFSLEPDEALLQAKEAELAEDLREKIVKAVKRRLASDVPLGCFLSGGIDSSCILAAMTRLMPKERIDAFTIGFEDQSFDESSYARQVADFFGVQHHVNILSQDYAAELIDKILPQVHDPLGDASILPTYMLSDFTRRKVTVALSGDGGDELFAGYDPFRALGPASFYSRFVPRPAHELLRFLVGHWPCSDRNMSLDFKIRRTLRGLSYAEPFWLPVWMSPLEPREMGEFFDHPLPPEELYAEALQTWRECAHLSPVDRALTFFTRHYLIQDILVKVDRASMLNSLESRAVFLDNEIVDFCRLLPASLKFKNGQGKAILRRALAGWLPQNIIDRPKKGFGAPINRWLREMPLDFWHLNSFINVEAVNRRLQEHRQKRGDHRLALWAMLALDRSLEH